MRISRRTFLKRTLAAGIFLGAGSVAYAGGYGRHGIDITRVPLDLGVGRPLRVGLLSDIHFDPLYETAYLEHAFRLLAAEQPDLVLHAGDFVSHTTHRFEEFGALAARFIPPLGAFAALGNHDHWAGPKKVRAILERHGIRVLRNSALPLPGHPGWFVAGLESYWGGHPDPSFFARYPATARFLAIVHEPDAWDRLPDPRIRLQVSGHTHGGQVRAPLFGALQLPKWGKRYDAGLFHGRDDRHLYVTRGLGTVGLPVRFDCPPEITILELT